MLLCIRLESFAVPGGRPGLALPFLPSAEVVDSTLLYDPARFGRDQIGEEIGVGVGGSGESVDVDVDGRIRAWGVWKGPDYVEIKK